MINTTLIFRSSLLVGVGKDCCNQSVTMQECVSRGGGYMFWMPRSFAHGGLSAMLCR